MWPNHPRVYVNKISNVTNSKSAIWQTDNAILK